jgi:flagellin-like protein
MNSKRRVFRDRRGTVGIETAIIIIAFVIVASAVAYVIINMGYYAAQKSRDTISRGVESVSSSLEFDGSVIGKVDKNTPYIKYLIIPVRLSVGKSLVDLGVESVMVSVFSKSFTISDIYCGVYKETTDPPLEDILGCVTTEETVTIKSGSGSLTKTPIVPGSVTIYVNSTTILQDNKKDGKLYNMTASPPTIVGSINYATGKISDLTGVKDGSYKATYNYNTDEEVAVSVIYNDDGDTLLELNEKAFIVIQVDTSKHPIASYDTVTVEIRIGTGPALTIKRQIPPGLTPGDYVDLG